jgi:hypothetical protein
MRTSEIRTRVAGWEEPCHPGSAMHDHAHAPLYPTLSHNATHIPFSLPLDPPGGSIRADRPPARANRDEGRCRRPCKPRCRSCGWASRCRIRHRSVRGVCQAHPGVAGAPAERRAETSRRRRRVEARTMATSPPPCAVLHPPDVEARAIEAGTPGCALLH